MTASYFAGERNFEKLSQHKKQKNETTEDTSANTPSDRFILPIGETVRLLEVCRSNQERASASIIEALDWQSSVCNTTRDLEYLEDYYQSISNFDAPNILLRVLQKLRSEYTLIGETDLAESILTRCSSVLPRHILIRQGLDPFHSKLKEATADTVMDMDLELASLRDELGAVRAVLENTADMNEREAEVRRLLEIAHTYAKQYSARGEAQLDLIIACIFPAISEACSTLDVKRGMRWEADVLLCVASFVLQQLLGQTTMEEVRQIFCSALQYQERAITMFEESGYKLEMGMANAMKASTYKTEWCTLGRPRESNAFTNAISTLDDAIRSMERLGNLELQRSYCHMMTGLWYKKFQDMAEDDIPDLASSETYSSTIKWIEEADRLASIERNNVSALSRRRAVLGKQSLQADKRLQEVQAMAIDVYSQANNIIGVWTWIQKSTARSLSDMLALGINIPSGLRRLIEEDSELMNMLDEEEQLTAQCKAPSSPLSDVVWQSRNQLEAHRDQMRTHPLLRQVLDIREGQSVSLSSLGEISRLEESTKAQRKIFFVDWCIVGGRCAALVVSDSGLSKIDIETNLNVSEWRESWAFWSALPLPIRG